MVFTSEWIPAAEFVYVESAVIILHLTDLLNTISRELCSHTSHLTAHASNMNIPSLWPSDQTDIRRIPPLIYNWWLNHEPANNGCFLNVYKQKTADAPQSVLWFGLCCRTINLYFQRERGLVTETMYIHRDHERKITSFNILIK